MEPVALEPQWITLFPYQISRLEFTGSVYVIFFQTIWLDYICDSLYIDDRGYLHIILVTVRGQLSFVCVWNISLEKYFDFSELVFLSQWMKNLCGKAFTKNCNSKNLLSNKCMITSKFYYLFNIFQSDKKGGLKQLFCFVLIKLDIIRLNVNRCTNISIIMCHV